MSPLTPKNPQGFEESIPYVECDCGARFQVKLPAHPEGWDPEKTCKQGLQHMKQCQKAQEKPTRTLRPSGPTDGDPLIAPRTHEVGPSLSERMEEHCRQKGWQLPE